jgi:1-acyl-sn-glycerol-3-phosphate acyltransferase
VTEAATALRASARLVRVAGLAAATLARSLGAARAGDRAEELRARAGLLAEAARRALRAHGLSTHATGATPSGPALLVANHLSYLDPLVIAAQVDCVPISKAELAGWPVFGAIARRTGVLFVSRGDPRSRREVMQAAGEVLRAGGKVLNFPEGTTSDGTGVLPFRRGLFAVAHELGVPVVPVALSYAPRELAWLGEATFLPHYLRLAAERAPSATLAFGEPIPPRLHPTAEALATAARDRTISLLEDPERWLKKTP